MFAKVVNLKSLVGEMKDGISMGDLFEVDPSKNAMAVAMHMTTGEQKAVEVMWAKSTDGTWGWLPASMLEVIPGSGIVN